MNALKHGLDAETLILPGEDEARYQDRREAWAAAYPPRDTLEASLLEQAVGLSWRLDRADRACAAHLAERIQLLQSAEYRRQQAEAEAAEAARIGEQLLAGPPPPKYDLAKIHARLVRLRRCDFAPYTPIFDLPSTQARMAQKRLGKPIPPDDPAHPELLLRRLRSTTAGCHWLLDRWTELRAALQSDTGWRPDERLRAVRLLAKLPADGLDDSTVRSIYLCCFVLGGDDPFVLEDQAREMANREFEDFLQRMKGRALPGQRPASREEARAWLLAFVDDVIAKLRSRAAMHAAREEAALASDRLSFDTSPAGRRLQRLQSRLHGRLLRTINLLMLARRRPGVSLPPRKLAPMVAASQSVASDCENVRNEANADPPDEAQPSISEGSPRSVCGGRVQPTECDSFHPMRCSQPITSGDDDKGPSSGRIVSATRVMSTDSEKVRNEANALPPAVATPAAIEGSAGPETEEPGLERPGETIPRELTGVSSRGLATALGC
jgi:hypothetical protein